MLVDANIFLELELQQDRWQECAEFFNRVDRGDLKVFTTDFIIDSIVLKMEVHDCDFKKIRNFFLALLSSKGLIIYAHNFLDKIVATKHMEKFKLDFDDALALEAMYSTNIKEIVSFDAHFDKIPGIKRMVPSEFI